jgi:hypothetical protein
MGPIVISNKIKTNHTYLTTTNYWAPLHEPKEEYDIEEINTTPEVQSKANTNSNKWMRRVD